MTIYESTTFENASVRLDGNKFRDCKFDACELLFGGAEDVGLVNCTFHDCRWQFDGAASSTVQFLKAMRTGMGPGGAALVEQLCSEILAES